MTSATCTSAGCEATATKVMAMPPFAVPCVDVNPYCDEHAQVVREMGGWFAAGDALADDLQQISGVRR